MTFSLTVNLGNGKSVDRQNVLNALEKTSYEILQKWLDAPCSQIVRDDNETTVGKWEVVA